MGKIVVIMTYMCLMASPAASVLDVFLHSSSLLTDIALGFPSLTGSSILGLGSVFLHFFSCFRGALLEAKPAAVGIVLDLLGVPVGLVAQGFGLFLGVFDGSGSGNHHCSTCYPGNSSTEPPPPLVVVLGETTGPALGNTAFLGADSNLGSISVVADFHVGTGA